MQFNQTSKFIARLLLQCGLDLRLLKNIASVYWYFSDKAKFVKEGGIVDSLRPIITDRGANAGNVSHVYFHQDLLVAQYIFEKNPVRHVDIGSRIDGFVGHVASFRKIDVIDIRPLTLEPHGNIQFLQADVMKKLDVSLIDSTDSISCLHAIEHFGLGRYGDPLDPNGHIKGLANILKILKPGGNLYISFPIGQKTQVQFNEQRIFKPDDIFSWVSDKKTIFLKRFDYIDSTGEIQKNISPWDLNTFQGTGCGIYTFTKVGE